MSHIGFFDSQMRSFPYLTFGQLSLGQRGIAIEVLGKEKKVYQFDFDHFFGIREKIQSNLAEIQDLGATIEVKRQLEELKGKLVIKINSDRGWFKKMSRKETELINAYFNYVNVLLDTPVPGRIRKFLSGAFKIAMVSTLAYAGLSLLYANGKK